MNMCDRLIFILMFFIGFISSSLCTPCVTMDKLEGNCVPLDSCNSILAKATVMRDAIAQSKCGVLPDFSVLVCCAKWRNAKNCGSPGDTSKIERFPWVVDVVYRIRMKSYSQRCTGSLINSRYALTAAHCIADLYFIFKPYSIRVKKNCSYQDFEILKNIVHPNYNRFSFNKEHDVALFKLTEKITFDEHVQPICLPRREDFDENSLFEGQMLTIFSKGPPERGRSNRQKHPIAMPLRNSSVCNKIYKDIRIELSASQICVGGEPGKDSCPGDSGSPLMQQVIDSSSFRWYQVGLVSLGPQKCGGKIPGIYVKLDDYMGWIEGTVDDVD